jgi:competence protein ComEA
LAVALAAFAVLASRSGPPRDSGSGAVPRDGPAPLAIDVNRDPARLLLFLPGIGPVRADAIVDERARDGPYESLDDLARVRGIGPATVAAVRNTATVRATLGAEPRAEAAPGSALREADP